MRNFIKASLLLALGLLSVGAHAHGVGSASTSMEMGFFQGLLHPFAGLDHLAAMLAVGLWSASTARRFWVAPMAFANLLLVGALLGMSGLALPGVEPLIAVSLLVLGLLLAQRKALSTFSGAALVGTFAIFHGAAHGQELMMGNEWFAPLLGMLVGTLALHIGGLAGGLVLRERSAWWSRLAGGLVALLGTVLLVQMA